MWISFYNKKGVGDVLMFTKGNLEREKVGVQTVANVTRIFDKETGETFGYNFHDISDRLEIEGNGQVHLSDVQMDTLNQMIYEQGYEPIPYDNRPRIVVGEVVSCVNHENSDHLHITETRVENETYQIVCGAPNVHADMRVVVALPGAVMPDGQVIWPGELRGVASYGMLCSAYELGADPEHQKKGILEIRADVETGTPFADISSDEML
ncbi:YtpR family tRNA-binding protein [Aerococcus suis]|uniref:tRNA-binding protein n=1 Tax=Aerococcus suis TaxID=371602 RepID=A0A1W1YIH6_9LACT|nr:DUF4479 and tRNA-binding domain-containing protein [Aerococcus suis]MCI7240151.1 DUF4479 and tRNA-binding domain-containing protein [Aerococcus suis]MDY4646061.1 DUF4479 and tRNA-binding domain-containing protein [Aerococcus suis]SMC35969.1 tRNA-binding protein [Aerococcus suis]